MKVTVKIKIWDWIVQLFEGLAEWHVPQGGMFLWIKALGIEDSFDMLMERGLERKVMALPGREFMAYKQGSPHIRVSFSLIPEEQIEQVRRKSKSSPSFIMELMLTFLLDKLQFRFHKSFFYFSYHHYHHITMIII